MDVHELSGYLAESGINFEPTISESLGGILLCFGDIEVDKDWGDRLPPDTEEQRKALLKITLEERQKAVEERLKRAATGLYKPPTEEEEQKLA